jgi:hypothetical protein
MSEYRLTTKAEAASTLQAHFEGLSPAQSILSIREDKCFIDSDWLELGKVTLKPGSPEPGEEASERLLAAVNYGFFEWRCIAADEAVRQLAQLLQVTKDEHRDKARRALDAIACVAARIGLIHPLFDADALGQMPFRRPTTVVVDTSSILQGGLDFVVHFLYPMARLKVPAIAHMEILNVADNYFKSRRAATLTEAQRPTALLDHVMSQGGQRALLRLELQTDAEIERGRLGADPLRGVVQNRSDAEDKKLGLQEVQRSFADRLIFETARQHLSYSSPDHPVMLMTADQGLARMTLGEGMPTLFFEATSFGTLSGRTLSGTTFDPFSGKVYPISLTEILWEFAVTFGMARLETADGTRSVEVCAIGESLAWSPYHAKDDLLWMRSTNDPEAKPLKSVEAEPAKTKPTEVSKASVDLTPAQTKQYAGSYKFGLAKMFHLIDKLASAGSLTPDQVLEVLSLGKGGQTEDYRNFLLAGGFTEGGTEFKATSALQTLVAALKKQDFKTALNLFKQVPSFAGFVDFLLGVRADNPVAQRAIQTYTGLAEVVCVGFEIPGERVCGTPNQPSPEVFTDLAFRVYEGLARSSDDYVLTGRWLQGLVRESGIHPIASRRLLEEAREKGLLQRFTEGSTPETGYQNHTLYVLDTAQGGLNVRRLGIFEGDFLIPGKSSVSIRLKRGNE